MIDSPTLGKTPFRHHTQILMSQRQLHAKNPTTAITLAVGLLLLPSQMNAADHDQQPSLPDLEYARVGDHSLRLDLHLPANRPKSPLIVWVHGGAWRSGSKSSMPLGDLVQAGYAVASVDYRLSTEARFPAQIHDIKASIRFLRANRSQWNLPEKIVIAGNSAGGHLAALMGVSNDHTELEGTIGSNLPESSDVQGVVSFYGASNLTTILDQSTPHGLSVRIPALDLLLGAQPRDAVELARLASPVFQVDADDPPLLLLHGDQDPQMPINQAHELEGAYQSAKLRVEFVVVHGAAHGGDAFHDEERTDSLKRFLESID